MISGGLADLADGPLDNSSERAPWKSLSQSEKMNKTFLQGNEIGEVIEEQVLTRKLHLICEVKVRLVCHYVNCYGLLERDQEAQ